MEKLKTHAPTVARILLGLIYFVFGLAGLLNLIPPPADLPEAMIKFSTALAESTYFMPLLKLTETVCGLLLLVRFAPALSLVILAPITINIFFVHAFLTPGLQNLIMPIVMIVLHALAASKYWPVYQPLFKRH